MPESEMPVQPTTVWENYEFGTPLQEGETVEDAWFDNAVFLGDSRTEGLQVFSGLTYGDFYWNRGQSVFHADDTKRGTICANGVDMTMLEALGLKEYGAVYVMLGINDLGYDVSEFELGLGVLMDRILEIQPGAVVYLQTMPPINDEAARKAGLSPYENNGNVARFNEVIVRVAAEKRVVLLDTASVYRGADGQLPAELTSDGIHFTYGGYTRWADYLRGHVIEPEDYFYNRERACEEDRV